MPNANPLAYAPSALLPLLASAALQGQLPASDPLVIPRVTGSIPLDGRLDGPGWVGAARIDSFYEVWPGDNVVPPARTAVVVTYDANYVYVGVRAEDPDPHRIRAAYTTFDNIGSADDYVSVLLDTRGDGRSAELFRLSPRGIRADGRYNEAQMAEDLTPDFDWDGVAVIDSTGWTAEFRIPFSSLRYGHDSIQTWGIIVHRHYPRAFPRSFLSVRLPRGSNCLLCAEQRLARPTELPAGGSFFAAPYIAATARPASGTAPEPSTLRVGGDVKWIPGASTALDATVHPDFSQIEADVPQLGVNAPFALSYPEKRPFFLEGNDLFQTPVQAAYTRSITAPEWGIRLTGQAGRSAYTVLVGRDAGGGSVILPGPTTSSLAPQAFSSVAAIMRERTTIHRGFVGLLATDREVTGGNAFNRLAAADFQLNTGSHDQVAGQLLGSDTRFPNRPDLADAWQGGTASGAAAYLAWHHVDPRLEWFTEYRDIGNGVRADNGFLPQVGVRLLNGWTNLSFYPSGPISWVNPWVRVQYIADRAGAPVSRWVYAGIQAQGVRGLNVLARYSDERMSTPGGFLGRRYVLTTLDFAPGRAITAFDVTIRLGGDVDVTNGRPGRGGEISDSVVIHPDRHLEFQGLSDATWLDVSVPGGQRRLFTETLARIRATYAVDTRASIRLIAQHLRLVRDPLLYDAPVDAVAGGVTATLLVTYRWNWNSAVYVGFGDESDLAPAGAYMSGHQQVFVKAQAGLPR